MWSYPSTHLKTFHPQGYGLLQRPETANLVQVLPDLDVLLGNWRARCHNWIQFENQTNSTPLKFTSYSRCIRLDIRLVVLEVAALAATTLDTAGFGGVQAFSIFCFTTQGRHRPWVIVRRRHHVEHQSSCLSGNLHSWLLKLVCWSHNSPHLWATFALISICASFCIFCLFFLAAIFLKFSFFGGPFIRDFFRTFHLFFTGHFKENRP